MKVLLVGGAGGVGTMTTPYLAKHHTLRVLDLRPPAHPDVEYVEGSIADPDALERALDGCDTFIDLVMQRSPTGITSFDRSVPMIINQYTVNVLGVHLLLDRAHALGIRRGVYTSTMSVHDRERSWYSQEELVPLDSPHLYGLTKGLGELICAHFARYYDMNLIALRITGPRARADYIAERESPKPVVNGRLFVTDEEDLARAYLAALEAVQVGHGRFDAVFIAGDEAEENHNLSKARRLLNWAPISQKYVPPHSATSDRSR